MAKVEILDFYANWCGPCQVMHPVLEEVQKEIKGKAALKKIDVDKETTESSKFGVLSIPTYVVLQDGKEVDRATGVQPKEWFTKAAQKYSK